MRDLKDSDIFSKVVNKNDEIFNRLNQVFTDPSTIVLNKVLFPEIKKKILDKRKDAIVSKMGTSITDQRMILIVVPPEKNLPGLLPFMIIKQAGVRKVVVNLTNVIVQNRDNETKTIDYEMGENVNKVYSLIYTAYLALDHFANNKVLADDALYYSSIIWAEMFCKPLFATIGKNNYDRVKAYMYYSIRFFLTYYMQCPQVQVDSLSKKYIGKDSNPLVNHMEDVMQEKGINPNENFTIFLRVLCDNEITNIKGIRLNTIENSMNLSYYISKFTQMYSSNAILSLCSYPYFIFTIFAALTKCNYVKDRSFESIFKENQPVINKLMLSVIK